MFVLMDPDNIHQNICRSLPRSPNRETIAGINRSGAEGAGLAVVSALIYRLMLGILGRRRLFFGKGDEGIFALSNSFRRCSENDFQKCAGLVAFKFRGIPPGTYVLVEQQEAADNRLL
jgi:hypothetical protein